MIADLKPYPAMKDSGMPWLGAVPWHWEMELGKWLFRKMNRPIWDASEVVTCFRDGIVTLRKNRRVRGFTESLKEIGYQGIRRGDLVIHGMDAFAGAIGVADSDGKGTPVYSVCEPGPTANAQYYAFALREMARSQWIQALAKGIRERSTDFRFEGFGSQPVPLPPLPEQAAIVRFLDHADRRIRRYIRAKQKLIALLEEQKQAVVHEAVTGRVDIRTGQPYPAYKDSGVEWLGDVPEHWEMRRLKSKLRPVDRRSSSGTETLLSLRRDLGVVVYAEHFSRPPQGATLVGYKLVEAGQLVINRLQANNGLLFCSGLSGVVSPDYSVFAPRSPVDMEYLGNLLRTVTYKAHFRRESTGLGTGSAGFLRLYDDRLLATPVALPPLEEQSTLLVSLSEITASLCRAIGRQHVEIELLREYRARLIADVVTGKLDVRGAADGLPEVDSLADDDALTTQAAETGVMELEDATESPEEFAMENEATV